MHDEQTEGAVDASEDAVTNLNPEVTDEAETFYPQEHGDVMRAMGEALVGLDDLLKSQGKCQEYVTARAYLTEARMVMEKRGIRA